MTLRDTPHDVTSIHKGVVHTEPCVFVMKLRAIRHDGEIWGNWCITHYHWLNDQSATKLSETL